jgi:hypothetical protein
MQAQKDPPVSEHTIRMRPRIRRSRLTKAQLLVEFDRRPNIARLETDLVEMSDHAVGLDETRADSYTEVPRAAPAGRRPISM